MMGNEAGDDQQRGIHRESHKLGKEARTGAAASVVGPALGENAATVLCHPLLDVLQTKLSFVTTVL